MNILLLNVPSRTGKGAVEIPAGLLYAGSAAKRAGHKVVISDLYLQEAAFCPDGSAGDFIDGMISDIRPDVVGFGGIATSYGRTKALSLRIRRVSPRITQIAGGALSSVSELLFDNTSLDAVFHKEAEVSLPVFLERLAAGKDFSAVADISYRQGNKVLSNSASEQVLDLDSIPFPDYSLIDLKRYRRSMDGWLNEYAMLLKGNKEYLRIRGLVSGKFCLPIVSARGCTNRCSFCYRHLRGYRQHSVDYVIEHMKLLRRSCGVGGFQFFDELFNADPKWVDKLCSRIKDELPDIFYMVGGARVDRIDEDTLRRMRESGCVEIGYGHESGSDRILKELNKNVTRQRNIAVTNLTRGLGINAPVQLVVGSPSETDETIDETIDFLRQVDAYTYSLNYLIPLPQTPIWKVVTDKALVNDLEQYLDMVAVCGGQPLVNLTSAPEDAWKKWALRIRKQMRLHYYRRTKGVFYWGYRVVMELIYSLSPFFPAWVKKFVPNVLKMRV